jgi:hypothetical protein
VPGILKDEENLGAATLIGRGLPDTNTFAAKQVIIRKWIYK